MPRLVRSLTVKNEHGLHTRPATVIVQLLERAKSSVLFSYNNETINAKSILGILMLAAGKNAKITVIIEGEDAENVMELLLGAFEAKFDEKKKV